MLFNTNNLFNMNNLFAYSEVVSNIADANSFICTVKWFHELQSNTNNSIQYSSFICAHINSSKYCYFLPIIQFFHSYKWFQVLLWNANNSI